MAPTKKPLRTPSEPTTDSEIEGSGVRVLALRKERSRDAARSRRSRENVQYLELAKLLPLPSAITSQLDKASVIRLTISFLKFRNLTEKFKPKQNSFDENVHGRSVPQSTHAEKDCGFHVLQASLAHKSKVRELLSAHEEDSKMNDSLQRLRGTDVQQIQALEGFLFALSADGKFLYVSETVSVYLGLSQVELIGSNILNYIHEDDQLNFSQLLSSELSGDSCEGDESPKQSIDEDPDTENKPHIVKSFIRMKCALVKRGGSYTKTMGYKVIQIVGRVVPFKNIAPSEKAENALVAIGNPLPFPSVCELRVQSHAFVSRVGMDLKIVFCEGGIKKFMDFRARDIVGLSAYEFYHLEDMCSIQGSHNQCVKAGQTVTSAYRWMNKHGGWVWMLTHATVVKRNGEEGEEVQILCVNHVISDIEHRGVVMHGIQSYFANKQDDVTDPCLEYDDCELSSEKLKQVIPTEEEASPEVMDSTIIDDILSDTSLTDDNFASQVLLDDSENAESALSFDLLGPNNNNNMKSNCGNEPSNGTDRLLGSMFSMDGNLSNGDPLTAGALLVDDPVRADIAGPGSAYWSSLFGEDSSLVEELMAELQREEEKIGGFIPKQEGFTSCQEAKPSPHITQLPIQTPISSLTTMPEKRPSATMPRPLNYDTVLPQKPTVGNRQTHFGHVSGQVNDSPPINGSMGRQNGSHLSTPLNGNVVVSGNNLLFDNRGNGFGGNSTRTIPIGSQSFAGMMNESVPGNEQYQNNDLNTVESTLFNARFNDLSLRNSQDYNQMHNSQRLDFVQPQVRELKVFRQLNSLLNNQGRENSLYDTSTKLPPPYQEIQPTTPIPPPLRHFSYSSF